nr:hypothetical protein [Tanacetum cinerariifolium]
MPPIDIGFAYISEFVEKFISNENPNFILKSLTEADDDDDDQEDEDEQYDDDQDSDNDDDDFVHPKLSTHDEEAKDEESFDPIVQTPSHVEDSDDEIHGMNVRGDKGPDAEDDDEELYRDVNINLEGRDIQTTYVHTTQVLEDTHVTLTPVNFDGQQQSSFVSSHLLQACSTEVLMQFVGAVSSIPGIIDRYIDHRMNEAVKVAVQLQSDRLQDEAQVENEDFINKLDENIQKIIKEQVNEQVKKILTENMERNKSIHRSNEQMNRYKDLVNAYECDKIILDTYRDIVMLKRRHDDANKDNEPSAGSDQGSKRRREGKEPELISAPKEKASKTTGKSTEGSKSHQKTASESAPAEEPMQTTKDLEEPSHQEFETVNELMDTPVDFSAFLMNRFKVDTLTPELLASPTYELMKGSCKRLVELEFFLKEVYKATTGQLDRNNPERQQYPHNLLKPLPLIPNSRGCRVLPFDHFINNDLEYLHSGASSRKYTTFVTKTKTVDYGHIMWIEDLFYRFTVNRESARDVYCKCRIIAATEHQIIEWHNYKHLDWITVRKDDDKLYKFKEGNLKGLHIQDIEDMLLLLVQGKLTNLTVEERITFNVSLRMFTRSIVIQRHEEDLQLGIKSYQNKLNLTNPDTYRTDLKRKEAYIAYSNPREFIYQTKDKQNRLMRIDELHKFSDDMLNDVRIALDDPLKEIRLKYLPQTIWRRSDIGKSSNNDPG